MKKKVFVRRFIVIMAFILTGCSEDSTASMIENAKVEESMVLTSQEDDSANREEFKEDLSESAAEELIISPKVDVEENEQPIVEPTSGATPEPQPMIPDDEKKDEYGMTEEQKNSFSMLYYLAITAEEIRISKDNRLILDDIYILVHLRLE